MGFFIIDDDQDSPEARRKRRELVEAYAQEAIEITKDTTNENFPSFIWEPLVNEFDNDNYRIRGSCSSDAVVKAYTIGRKYNDYWRYLDAIDVYQTYVSYIEDNYGEYDLVTKCGGIYSPPFPKLMNKRQNKKLLRSGFMPSRIDLDEVLDSEKIQQMIEDAPEKGCIDDESIPIPESRTRMVEKMMKAETKSYRKNSIYTYQNKYSESFDAIVNFLTSSNADGIDGGQVSDKSFSEVFEEVQFSGHEEDQDAINEIIASKEAMIVNGKVMQMEKFNQLKILEELTKNGYNFYEAAISSGMDKTAVKMINRRLGIDMEQNLSPKKLKKLKKKRAQERKRKAEKQLGDERLHEILMKNKRSVGGNNVNFAVDSLFK